MTLNAPFSNPDPAKPSNWSPSVATGGSPGSIATMTFALWSGAVFGEAADPAGDPDRDGFINLLEYALMTNPLDPESFRETEIRRIGDVIEMEITVRSDGSDLGVLAELTNAEAPFDWIVADSLERRPNPKRDGTDVIRVPIGEDFRFGRFRFVLAPAE